MCGFACCLRVWLMISLCSLSNHTYAADVECPSVPQRPSCVCKHKDGIIDLTPYGLSGDQAPRFQNVEDSDGDALYYYNPCNAFTKDNCKNINVCLIKDNQDDSYLSIGELGTEKMYISSDGTPYVHYEARFSASVQVFLHCTKDESPTIVAEKLPSSFDLTYKFHLSSCQVCPGGCVNSHGSTVVGVVGIVLIILFFAAIATYFIAGAAILKFKHELTGTDLIPNKNLWIALLLLIKDGCIFSFGPFRRLLSKQNDYQTIK